MSRKNSHSFLRTPTTITLVSTTDDNENAKSEKSMKRKFEDFCSETSFTPMSHVYNADSVWKKLVWVVFSLGLTFYMIFQCQNLISRYLKYPSEVDMELAFSPELEFPSVTICNLNPIRYSELMGISDGINIFEGDDEKAFLALINSLQGTEPDYPGTTVQPADGNWTEQINNTSYNQWDNLAEEFYSQVSSPNQAAEQFVKLAAWLPSKTIEAKGHRKEDLILSCRWQGYSCSPRNFTSLVNNKYGNCFTFNTGTNMTDGDSGLMTSSPGPLYGLVLEIFIEQEEYTPELSPEAGARVLIHQRGKIPFPEDEGFTISPGFLTSVGMRKTRITRLPSPHGSCLESFVDTNSVYDEEYAIYSKQACMKSCLQHAIIQRCGCGVPSYPIPQNDKICRENDGPCTNDVEDAYRINNLGCGEACPLPCNDETHALTISNAKWPARMYKPTDAHL